MVCLAQLPPELGYALPAGGQCGTTVDVVLGGYDWTPDMQVFVHDSRVKLEITGGPSQVLITEPPYWFGYKARGYAWPLPREFPARLTIPAEVSPGLLRWQVANANGASAVGQLHVGTIPSVNEQSGLKTAQRLPNLPATVSGQIRRIEEIDRYQFHVPTSGPVTIELFARRLGSPLHGMLQVRDADQQVILDVADTEGRDFASTMFAKANVEYELSLHDLDFAGDRSYIYRIELNAGPHVLATYPAAGQRGETCDVEFIGPGLATGSQQIEHIVRKVTFPVGSGISSFEYAAETDWGTAKPVRLLVTDTHEFVDSKIGESTVSVPCAVTGAIETRFGSDQYAVSFPMGQTWAIAAQAKAIGSPLDVDLTVFGPDGKQLAANDDVPGTTDAFLSFTPPVEGVYRIVVSDRSGKSGSRAANYRLSIEVPKEDFEVTVPTLLAIPIGGQGKLVLKCTRKAGFKEPIPVSLAGLPAGLNGPENPVIAGDKSDLTIDLNCPAEAAANASLCEVSVNPVIGGQPSTRHVGKVLIATTLKPRFKLTPEGLDDVRKVHRGSTYLFPMLIERLEGFEGPITLEMTSKQQRHRQGLAGDELIIPPNASRIDYPIFVPEWMETTKTSRMILNGAAMVADPQGNVRTVLQRQELRFGILPQGALLKLTHRAGDITTVAGSEIQIPLALSVAPELKDPITIEFVSRESQVPTFTAKPLTLAPGERDTTVAVSVSTELRTTGEIELLFRASTKKEGWPVISETKVIVNVKPRP